jgi:hypothetical protein
MWLSGVMMAAVLAVASGGGEGNAGSGGPGNGETAKEPSTKTVKAAPNGSMKQAKKRAGVHAKARKHEASAQPNDQTRDNSMRDKQ